MVARWGSTPDREANVHFAGFDSSGVADDHIREILERIGWELSQLQRGCHRPIYGLRAHCWNPDVTRVKYGYYLASFNEMVLSAPLGNTRCVTLPDATAREGGYVEVADFTGDAATTNITVKTVKGQTIGAASTYTIYSDYAEVGFRSDGTKWYAIAGANVPMSSVCWNTRTVTDSATADFGDMIYITSGTPKITLPQIGTTLGKEVAVVNRSGGAITVSIGDPADSIDGLESITVNDGGSVRFGSVAANTWETV